MRALVLLVMVGSASTASAECRLSADLYEVPANVEVPGRDPIDVQFRSEQRIELLPSSRGEGLRFRTIGPVELMARFPPSYSVIAAVHVPVLQAGPIRMHDGALLRVESVTDVGLFAFVRIASDVTARIGPVSCSGLHILSSADLSDSAGEPPDDLLTHIDGRLDGPLVRVSRDGVTVIIDAREPLGVARLERRGSRIRVRRDYPSGITLDGWVGATEVTVIERRALQLMPYAGELSFLSGSSRSCGTLDTLQVREGVLAVIRDGPHGTPWATVREGVRLAATAFLDGYALYELPGTKRDCDLAERAWISGADVEEPASP